MMHKLLVWRIYDNRVTRDTGECKMPITSVESVDDINAGSSFPTILERIFFDDGGPSGIGRKTDIQHVTGPDFAGAVDIRLERFLHPWGKKELHHRYREHLIEGAAALKRMLEEEISTLGGQAACSIRVFRFDSDWKPVSSPSFNGGVIKINRIAENEVERYSNIAFLISSSAYTSTPPVRPGSEALENKLIVWRLISRGANVRRTGESSTPISEVELVDDLNTWSGLPFILDNLFSITDSPSGIRDMYRMQHFKGLEDDLVVERTLSRHLSLDETKDNQYYREQIRAGARLLKLRLIEEMYKLGGKESCTIKIFQYHSSLQRARPIRDKNGKRVNSDDYITVDGMDYINWAYLLSAPSSAVPTWVNSSSNS